MFFSKASYSPHLPTLRILDAVGTFDGGGQEPSEGRGEGREESQAQGVDLSLGREASPAPSCWVDDGLMEF